MLIYDVDKIENLYQDFEKVCKNFKNKEYDDFRTSYFYSCNDSVIVKLRNRIQAIYDNIQKGYDMIDKVWKEYIDDVGNFDKSIASGGNCGIHDGGVNSIVSKICSIELYDTAGVSTSLKSLYAGPGTKILNVLKRTAASIINTAVFGVISGLLKFVEGIVDCAVMIVGAVVGLPVLLFDAGKSLITGKKDFSNSKNYYNKMIQCVGYDIVENQIKNRFYSTKFGKWFNDNSYAPFKSDGVGYKIGEAVGEIVGTVVLTIATMGAGGAVTAAKSAATAGTKIGVKTALKVGTKGAIHAVKSAVPIFGKKVAAKTIKEAGTKVLLRTSTELLKKKGKAQVVAFAVRGAGMMGKKTQENYNELIKGGAEKGNLSGSQMAKLVGTSGIQAGVDAAAYSLTYAGGLKTLDKLDDVKFLTNTKAGRAITTVANKAGKSKKISGFITDKVLKYESTSKAAIQVAKTFANDGIAAAGDIKKFNLKETATDAAINAVVSVGYDKVVAKGLQAVANASKTGLDNITAGKEAAKVADAGAFGDDAFDTVADVSADKTAIKTAIKTNLLKVVNRTTDYAAFNSDGKKIVGTAIKKTPTNFVDDAIK